MTRPPTPTRPSTGSYRAVPTPLAHPAHGAAGRPRSQQTTVSMAAVRPAVAGARRGRPRFLPVLAVILLAAWGYGILRPSPAAKVPVALRGVWVADDPRYEGRSLELDDSTVTVTYPGGRETTRLRSAEVRGRADTQVVILRHGDGTHALELSLGLVRDPDEHLVLRNPEAVRWVRQVGGGGVPNAPAAASPPRAGESAPR